MRGVWGCKVCLVLCRCEDPVETVSRLGPVNIRVWH